MRLLVIDEIHLLGDERGPVLEVIVSRTNFIASHTEHPVRVIGLSTALANARDLADWLGIKQVWMQLRTYTDSSSYVTYKSLPTPGRTVQLPSCCETCTTGSPHQWVSWEALLSPHGHHEQASLHCHTNLLTR